MATISETMGWRWATVRVIETRSYGDGGMRAPPRRFLQNLASGESTAELSGSATDMVSLDGPGPHLENAVDVVTYFWRVSGGLLYFLWKGGSDGGDVSTGCARSVNSASRYQ